MAPERRYLEGPVPRALAHRGLHPLGDENTLAAFARAKKAGARIIETDTRATSDGVALTFHDSTFDRVCGAVGLVAETSWADAQKLQVGSGEKIARLDEALAAFPDLQFNIDVKSADAIEPTVRAIADAKAENRVCLTSFDPATARKAVSRLAELTGARVTASASRNVVAAFRLLVTVGAPQRVINRLLAPYAALQIPRSMYGIPLVTRRTIAAAHAAGCEIHVWTIDDESDMRDLLDLGVDGIVGNRVDLALRVISESYSSK